LPLGEILTSRVGPRGPPLRTAWHPAGFAAGDLPPG